MLLVINDKNNKYETIQTKDYINFYVYLNEYQKSKLYISSEYSTSLQIQFRAPKNIIPIKKEPLYLIDPKNRKIELDNENFYGDYMNNTALAEAFFSLFEKEFSDSDKPSLDQNKLVYSYTLSITLPEGYSFVCEDKQIASVLGIYESYEYKEKIEGYRMININLCKSLKVYSSLAYQGNYIENNEKSLLLRSPIGWENGSITTLTSGNINIQGAQLKDKIFFQFLTDEDLNYPLPEKFELVLELEEIIIEKHQPTEESQLLTTLIQTMGQQNGLIAQQHKEQVETMIQLQELQKKALENVNKSIKEQTEIAALTNTFLIQNNNNNNNIDDPLDYDDFLNDYPSDDNSYKNVNIDELLGEPVKNEPKKLTESNNENELSEELFKKLSKEVFSKGLYQKSKPTKSTDSQNVNSLWVNENEPSEGFTKNNDLKMPTLRTNTKDLIESNNENEPSRNF